MTTTVSVYACCDNLTEVHIIKSQQNFDDETIVLQNGQIENVVCSDAVSITVKEVKKMIMDDLPDEGTDASIDVSGNNLAD